ncbi:Acetyltransferase (GNAT) domain-containing protein [Actinacidiphila alni]|uniref:Acetyltransferase (GNAT) domain-containing protein n=1 Tax=Actinacidiphila alni TaxID=380248 RepID=A0A1I2E3G2_9ACTN|nr:GNAT family N-acetyltransferase [Actinacidiphila alni]SFE87434.1 Acetyltransferase (GNAT) domain-containing protein [Actinacidiphila alni]
MSTPVTTWSLELTSPDELRPAADAPAGAGVRIMRAEVPSAEFGRFLYTAVGADCAWRDRLPWPPERWRAHLELPGTEVWVAYERGTPAGYVELGAQDAGVVEILYFGLLPDFRGRGLGGRLLSFGTRRAWDLADRWEGREPTKRVWVHTCSLDGPYALENYRRRGFRVFDTVTEPAAGTGSGAAPGTASGSVSETASGTAETPAT